MKKIIFVIGFIVAILVAPSCGDPEDTTAMYDWKDVAYAFNMIEEENSLKGLHVEITYVDQMAIERTYDYSGFERWDQVFTHLPWGFIPRMKATVIQPEDVIFTDADFPAVIHIMMGVSDGDNPPRFLDQTETFETLSDFNKYIKSLEDKTYKVYPISTEMGK